MTVPDEHAVIAASRLLGLSPEDLNRLIDRYLDDGLSADPAFSLSYQDAADRMGVPVSTLRARVHRGTYIEGLDYERRGPRTVRFSRRILNRRLNR